MQGIGENRYELEVSFPMNLIYKEIIYVDNDCKTSVDLMHKHGVKYFNCLKVMLHPDYPNTRLVLARIHKWETAKWKAVLDDLLLICPDINYRRTCENLYEIVKSNIKPMKSFN